MTSFNADVRQLVNDGIHFSLLSITPQPNVCNELLPVNFRRYDVDAAYQRCKTWRVHYGRCKWSSGRVPDS